MIQILLRSGWKARVAVGLLLTAILLLAHASLSFALQPINCRAFTETERSVCGRFLQYWNANGGLSQQGYPISDEMQEISDFNGKSYVVQYFERALFEMHPEIRLPMTCFFLNLAPLDTKIGMEMQVRQSRELIPTLGQYTSRKQGII